MNFVAYRCTRCGAVRHERHDTALIKIPDVDGVGSTNETGQT